MLARLGLRARVLLFFAALGAGAVLAIAGGLTLAYLRLADPAVLSAFVQAGLMAGFACVGLITWVWLLFDRNVARPIDTLAAALRARTHADLSNPLDGSMARYLGDLAPAATATTLTLSETRNALAEAVARETTRLAQEKLRLERLLSDVSAGVILCSGAHQLVFYNGTAAEYLGAGPQSGASPGLDRRLFDYLREGPILHSLRRLVDAGDADAASDLLCTTVQGARVLSGRMRLLPARGADPQGYVLTLTDVTRDLALHARREALLTDILDRISRPAAALQALMAVLPEGGLGPLQAGLHEEVAKLAQTATSLNTRIDDARADSLPFALARASDLLDGLRARLELEGITVETDPSDLLVRCNGFEVIALMAGLASAMAKAGITRALRLHIDEDQGSATLRMVWQGAPLSITRLEGWLAEPLEASLPETSRASVLASHATDIWPEAAGDGRQMLCLPIRQARRLGPRPKPLIRQVVYDFDLLEKERNTDIADTPLDDLTYVVFDTETTGLLPQQGDQIVQIAAVRIVNGRRQETEVFDTLVNPRRTIPPASTAVHGITDAMVEGAPFIEDAAARFHRFAAGSVLVAHNAPFDMAFLKRPALGLRFDMPILDTVLLSAVVFSQHDVHSLDALTHRLGITISEEARHTALGDTIATADAFLKLLPILRARGFVTFGQVLAEVRRHGRLLRDINT